MLLRSNWVELGSSAAAFTKSQYRLTEFRPMYVRLTHSISKKDVGITQRRANFTPTSFILTGNLVARKKTDSSALSGANLLELSLRCTRPRSVGQEVSSPNGNKTLTNRGHNTLGLAAIHRKLRREDESTQSSGRCRRGPSPFREPTKYRTR